MGGRGKDSTGMLKEDWRQVRGAYPLRRIDDPGHEVVLNIFQQQRFRFPRLGVPKPLSFASYPFVQSASSSPSPPSPVLNGRENGYVRNLEQPKHSARLQGADILPRHPDAPGLGATLRVDAGIPRGLDPVLDLEDGGYLLPLEVLVPGELGADDETSHHLDGAVPAEAPLESALANLVLGLRYWMTGLGLLPSRLSLETWCTQGWQR